MSDKNIIIDLARELCSFVTGVVADDNEGLFNRIAEELPLEIFRFPSGKTYNGWTVPQNWRVRKATLKKDGKVVFDGTSHTLGVGSYSRSFQGELDWHELQSHMVTNPHLPEAYMFHCMWQYRLWEADWAFSVPHNVYMQWRPGKYEVDLQTEYESGEMLVGHHIKRGRSEETIVFNSNTCHPHMANDGFAGSAVLIRLMQWLAEMDTYYTYRLVLGPEHLGSVFYLHSLSKKEIDAMVGGVFEEMPGTGGALKAASTFNGGHVLDEAFANVLRHHSKKYTLVPWREGAGNDETVWEAPGYEVPFVELTRCEDQFAPFAEYHSSLDTPDLMEPEQVDEMLSVLQEVVKVLEGNATLHRRFNGLICLANPEFNLYPERPDPAVDKDLAPDSEKWGHLVDSLFRYFDGKMTILEIAQRHDLDFFELRQYLERFQEKKLIQMKFAKIPRQVPEWVE